MTRSLTATRLLLILVALVGAASLAACHYPGGTRYSGGPSTYHSYATMPKTITLYDTRTGEAIWSVDIPVGRQLVLGFQEGTGPNEFYPDELVWGTNELGRRSGRRENRQPCPPADSRRLEWEIREAPELPGADPGDSPFPRPTN